MPDVGLYRRADVEGFVSWSRDTVLKLRDVAERATERARAAEAGTAQATERAKDAEERAARLESEKLALEEALARRDRDMQATLGRALLMVQEVADETARKADAILEAAQARADAIIAEAAMTGAGQAETGPDPATEQSRIEWEGSSGIWAADDDDELLGPLRTRRASGE